MFLCVFERLPHSLDLHSSEGNVWLLISFPFSPDLFSIVVPPCDLQKVFDRVFYSAEKKVFPSGGGPSRIPICWGHPDRAILAGAGLRWHLTPSFIPSFRSRRVEVDSAATCVRLPMPRALSHGHSLAHFCRSCPPAKYSALRLALPSPLSAITISTHCTDWQLSLFGGRSQSRPIHWRPKGVARRSWRRRRRRRNTLARTSFFICPLSRGLRTARP